MTGRRLRYLRSSAGTPPSRRCRPPRRSPACVAAGRVEEHRFVGEPPVAVARAADAAQRALADALLERELQAGVDERRGLAGAGRADDDVPRQVVEAVAAAPVLLQRGDRFLEPLAQLQRPRRSAASLSAGACWTTAAISLSLARYGAQPLPQLRQQPDDARRAPIAIQPRARSIRAARTPAPNEPKYGPANQMNSASSRKPSDDQERAILEEGAAWRRQPLHVNDLHAPVARRFSGSTPAGSAAATTRRRSSSSRAGFARPTLQRAARR